MDDFTFPTTAAAAPAEHAHLHLHRRINFPHFAAPPLWFPSYSPAAAAVDVRVASAASTAVAGGVVAGEEPPPAAGAVAAAEEGGELARRADSGAGAADEERMDLLWENFNEELEALRLGGTCSKADSAGGGGGGGMEAASDSESETAGCVPVLRASSRAGGTGHYRRTSWVLLMRIFRRLFVVEKTIATARKQARAL